MVSFMADRQKRSSRRRAQQEQNMIARICISLILIVFMIVMTAQIQSVYDKNQAYIAKEAELKQQLLDEEQRKAALEEYKAYLESIDHVEDVSNSKLGILYENQIIFREKKD